MTIKDIDLTGKVILVVDDTPTNYQLIKTALRKTGVLTILAENGQEAVEQCKKDQQIDLVLMDIRMPIMDGYEATRKIRQIKPNLPIIAQTSYAMQGDREQSIKAGCNDYISKPISLEDLRTMISYYLKK